MNHKSEVVRLREQIDLECQAIRRVFEEPAIVASHQSIDARYRNLHTLTEKLEPLVGKREATAALMDIYHTVVDSANALTEEQRNEHIGEAFAVSPSPTPPPKQLILAIYLVVNEQKDERGEREEQGAEGFLFYANEDDEDELNAIINSLPAEKRTDRAYLDIRPFTHGLTLIDGTVVPPTLADASILVKSVAGERA